MLKINQSKLFINENEYDFGISIKTALEYDDIYVILLGDNELFANNVLAIDSFGRTLWKINDILKIENPPANTVIKKNGETILAVLSSIGMLYEIDIKTKKLIKSTIMR